ncbi:MAG: RDD family protein [Spirochaetales bacterium]|nr:RDD family protein [Spirochaetales bacterium]
MENKRMYAGFIDFIITSFIMAILMISIIFLPILINHKGEVPEGFFDKIIVKVLLLTYLSMIYMVIRDILGERSIGKRILKLKITDLNSEKIASPKARFIRNITWLIAPIELLVFVFSGFRIGDKIARTKVVLEKDTTTL